MAKAACRPPYVADTSENWAFMLSMPSLPLCSTLAEMKQAEGLVSKAVKGDLHSEHDIGIPPCRRLEKIQIDHQSVDLYNSTIAKTWPHLPTPFFVVSLRYRETTYKEIKSVHNMDIQALIGNALGLCIILGCLLYTSDAADE